MYKGFIIKNNIKYYLDIFYSYNYIEQKEGFFCGYKNIVSGEYLYQVFDKDLLQALKILNLKINS